MLAPRNDLALTKSHHAMTSVFCNKKFTFVASALAGQTAFLEGRLSIAAKAPIGRDRATDGIFGFRRFGGRADRQRRAPWRERPAKSRNPRASLAPRLKENLTIFAHGRGEARGMAAPRSLSL